jgi:beta-lactamase class A
LISAVAAFAVLAGIGLVVVGVMGRANGVLSAGGVFSDPPPSGASPSPTGPTPEELARRQRAVRVAALTAAMKKYAATVPEFSVAVLDEKTGERFSFRGGEKYETASVVKVQVLACLLLTAQDKGRALSATELSLAKRMIRLSDNAATTALFSRLGRAGAISACNRRLGLTATKVNNAWGLTRTTVNDQVTLLGQLVATNSPLNAKSRKLAFDLMSTVDKNQDWGVPAAGRLGDVTTVKNGWLPRSTERNRWIINSVGRITAGADTDVSIAVLSHGHTSMPRGIKVIETAAKMTRQYLKY